MKYEDDQPSVQILTGIASDLAKQWNDEHPDAEIKAEVVIRDQGPTIQFVPKIRPPF